MDYLLIFCADPFTEWTCLLILCADPFTEWTICSFSVLTHSLNGLCSFSVLTHSLNGLSAHSLCWPIHWMDYLLILCADPITEWTICSFSVLTHSLHGLSAPSLCWPIHCMDCLLILCAELDWGFLFFLCVKSWALFEVLSVECEYSASALIVTQETKLLHLICVSLKWTLTSVYKTGSSYSRHFCIIFILVDVGFFLFCFVFVFCFFFGQEETNYLDILAFIVQRRILTTLFTKVKEEPFRDFDLNNSCGIEMELRNGSQRPFLQLEKHFDFVNSAVSVPFYGYLWITFSHRFQCR